ncbi:unnamed protein product [Sphagnum balticum]
MASLAQADARKKQCLRMPKPIRRILRFYSCPIVKFTNHMVSVTGPGRRMGTDHVQMWYIMYLLTYSYVLLFKYKSSTSFTWSEAFVYMWQLSFLMETLRLVLNVKVSNWSDRWLVFVTRMSMKIDVVAILISLAAFSLRWSLSGCVNVHDCFRWVIYGCSSHSCPTSVHTAHCHRSHFHSPDYSCALH